MPTPLAAAGVYASVARLSADPAVAFAGKSAAAGAGDTSFASVLKDAMGSLTATGQKSDAQAREMISGKGNMVNAVTAVAETEVAIDAVVAVRDRVIQAYEDIMKMPI